MTQSSKVCSRLALPIIAIVLFAAAAAASAAERLGVLGDQWWHGDCSHLGCLHAKLEQLDEQEESDKAFDEATGRDLRNFPPDRIVDFHHMKLQMRFDDLGAPPLRFIAIETLTFTPIGREATGLTLDAVGFKINSVKLDDKPVEHSYDGARLSMRFDPPLPNGAQAKLIFEYVCENPVAGMKFTPYLPEAPHYQAQLHTQGQTDTNKHWFICHDSPNVRLATELIVDAPAGFSVSGNGKLISNLTSGDRCVWHYLQEKPHVPYLVSLAIGKFDIVELPHPPIAGARVPMKVWAPQGLGDQALQTYGRTGEMIDLFEKRFGVPYPWDRYDQLIVKNFGSGGMENTSATNMYPTAILDKTALLDGDLDGLIAHELCHQWTGDLLTCKSWAHIWLNEGWATYGSALWNEQRFGEDGYLDSIRGDFRVAERDNTANPLPMVSNVYKQPWETFRRPANPYPKGASILHMLRKMLGEDVFWRGVHLYMNRHLPSPLGNGSGLVETSDFRYAMEEVSGLGLEWFFEQWCSRPGAPAVEAKVRYDGQTRELFIDLEQTQKIDAATPAFRFTLPVYVRTSNGEQTHRIEMRTKSASFNAVLDGPPLIVAIDPHLHVLKTISTDKPLNLWIEQAKSGPTIAARHEAIDALGKTDSPEHIALLEQIVRNNKLRHTLRNTAVDVLAGYGSPQAKDTLLALAGSLRDSGGNEARVRRTLVGKLRNYDKATAAPLLAEFATKDESYAVRVAAIDGLAHHKSNEHVDLLAELVEFRSQHDQVRNAALRALAELDDPRGLERGIYYAAYGHMDRSRPVAIETIADLAKHDSERAVTVLLALLNDPERRAIEAAGAGLAKIGDQRALDPISAMAENHADPALRRNAERWLKTLREKIEKASAGEEPVEVRRRSRR